MTNKNEVYLSFFDYVEQLMKEDHRCLFDKQLIKLIGRRRHRHTVK